VVGRLGARQARAPVVTSLVNVAYGPEQRANPALRPWKLEAARWIDRATATLARRFHSVSEYVAEVMAPRLGLRADRIDVIPRGRDASLLGEPTPERRAQVRRALGAGDDQLLVVAAARHEYQKGLDVLLDAWPAVRAARPDARLLVGGRPGNETASLEAKVTALGPASAVELIGPRDDVPDLMVAADVFVVPSRWEGFASIVLEAMALGTNLVASDIGPLREVAATGWARLMPPERPDALAQGVLAAAAQPADEAARRARLARDRFAGRFSLDAVADATLSFYERSLA
jgi:glycosyltransferase involved in cell wall biosynthesis